MENTNYVNAEGTDNPSTTTSNSGCTYVYNTSLNPTVEQQIRENAVRIVEARVVWENADKIVEEANIIANFILNGK